MSKKNPGVPNIERVRAENERRRSSAAQPQESKNKRERTRERQIAAEMKRAGDTPRPFLVSGVAC